MNTHNLKPPNGSASNLQKWANSWAKVESYAENRRLLKAVSLAKECREQQPPGANTAPAEEIYNRIMGLEKERQEICDEVEKHVDAREFLMARVKLQKLAEFCVDSDRAATLWDRCEASIEPKDKALNDVGLVPFIIDSKYASFSRTKSTLLTLLVYFGIVALRIVTENNEHSYLYANGSFKYVLWLSFQTSLPGLIGLAATHVTLAMQPLSNSARFFRMFVFVLMAAVTILATVSVLQIGESPVLVLAASIWCLFRWALFYQNSRVRNLAEIWNIALGDEASRRVEGSKPNLFVVRHMEHKWREVYELTLGSIPDSATVIDTLEAKGVKVGGVVVRDGRGVAKPLLAKSDWSLVKKLIAKSTFEVKEEF